MIKAARQSTWELNSAEPWSLYSVGTCNSVSVLSKGSSIFHFIGWLKFWLELSLSRCPTHRIVTALSWKISLSMHGREFSVSRGGPGSSVSFHRWPFVNHMSFFKHRVFVFQEWPYQRLSVEARSHDGVWERTKCHGQSSCRVKESSIHWLASQWEAYYILLPYHLRWAHNEILWTT